jgi:ATPase subunit of ABC transporter with duplicated ATPase domains
MENGDKLIVVDEGVIGSIGEEVEEVKEEVQMEKDVNLGHGEEEKKAEMSYVSKEELEEAKDELKEMIEEVKAALEEAKEKEVEAEEEKEEKAELSKHLAEPSAEPLRHNPEAKKPVTLKKIGVNRRGNSVMDRIMERISNIEN